MASPGWYWAPTVTIHQYVGVRCLLIMAILNLLSISLLLMLHPYETAYTFFIVHVVILTYLDITWLATALINPGIISSPDQECEHCIDFDVGNDMGNESVDMGNERHCGECGVCVEERGHHCHITGGCIGSGNRIAYYFFMLGMFLWVIDVISTMPYVYYLI